MVRSFKILLSGCLALAACDDSHAISRADAGLFTEDAGSACVPGSVRAFACEDDGGWGLEVCRADGSGFDGPILGCEPPEVPDERITSCAGVTAADRDKGCAFSADETCAVESERCCCADEFHNRLCEMDQLACVDGKLRLSSRGEAVCGGDAGCPAPLAGIKKPKQPGFDLGQVINQDLKVIAYWNLATGGGGPPRLTSTELDGTVALDAPCAATPAVKPYSAFKWSAPADGRYEFTLRPLWSSSKPGGVAVDYVLHLRRAFSRAHPSLEECSDGARVDGWPSVEVELARGSRLVLVVSAWVDSLFEHAVSGTDNPVPFELRIQQKLACDLSKPESVCEACAPGSYLCDGVCLVVDEPEQCGCAATKCKADERCAASAEAAGGYRCEPLDPNPNALDCNGDGTYESALAANACGCATTGGPDFCSWYVPTCKKVAPNMAVCSPLRCDEADGCVAVNAGTTQGL